MSGGEWGIAELGSGGGIGFQPANESRTRRYTGGAGRFADCGKYFYGPSEYVGSVLAAKLGRARILCGFAAFARSARVALSK